MDAFFVIGDGDTVLAFSLAGIRGRAVGTLDEAKTAILAAAAEARDQGPTRATVLLVTTGVAREAREVVDRTILAAGGPLVLEIPGVGERAGEGAPDDLVHRLLGMSA